MKINIKMEPVIKQFCKLKTPEESQKEMEEITKRELEKLQLKIKNNPELLIKKNLEEYSDEILLSDSEDDSTYVPSDTESSEPECYKPKKKEKINVYNKEDILKKDIITSFKKDIELENLEKKNYFKILELNNLSLENSQQKAEIENIKKINSNYEQILDFILKFIEYKNTKYFENYKEEQVSNIFELKDLTKILIDLQKRHETSESKSRELIDNLNKIEFNGKNIKIKDCYYFLIDRVMMKNYNNYSRLTSMINKQIDKLQENYAPYYIFMIFIISVISIFIFKGF